MMVASRVTEQLEHASWIRRMFEEGARLKAERGAENIFDFTLGNPVLEPPEEVTSTLRRIAAESPPRPHAYMPNAGYPVVREVIAGRLSRSTGVPFTAGHILMTVGSAGAINTVLRAMLEDGDEAIPLAAAAICELENLGITVGLVSGRFMGKLDEMAKELAIDGPIIAENGGLAKLHVDDNLYPLGYLREPALKALDKLKKLFPDSIRGREDNADRLIDVVFYSDVLSTEELGEHIDGDVQLLDSGYIRHLMQKGITKGKTLQTILNDAQYANLDPEEVMVMGDSPTDISLFDLFPNSVLVQNPNLPDDQTQTLKTICRYESTLSFGEGFTEIANHIINLRKA